MKKSYYKHIMDEHGFEAFMSFIYAHGKMKGKRNGEAKRNCVLRRTKLLDPDDIYTKIDPSKIRRVIPRKVRLTNDT